MSCIWSVFKKRKSCESAVFVFGCCGFRFETFNSIIMSFVRLLKSRLDFSIIQGFERRGCNYDSTVALILENTTGALPGCNDFFVSKGVTLQIKITSSDKYTVCTMQLIQSK